MKIGQRRITLKGVLQLLEAEGELWFPTTRKGAYDRLFKPKTVWWEDYFPSEVKRKVKELNRKGLVEMKNEGDFTVVKIKEEGKQQILRYRLDELVPKTGKWDGKWRIVFFDVPEKARSKRDMLRYYLRRLGMQEMQKSLFICPFDVTNEVKFLREVLGIPNGVKMGVISELENNSELRKVFEV